MTEDHSAELGVTVSVPYNDIVGPRFVVQTPGFASIYALCFIIVLAVGAGRIAFFSAWRYIRLSLCEGQYNLQFLPTSPVALDIVAIAIFLGGSYLNIGSDLQRKKFKDKTENRGTLYLYAQWLIRYSRHINYAGGMLWVS